MRELRLDPNVTVATTTTMASTAPRMAERTGTASRDIPGLECEPQPGHRRRRQPRRAHGARHHRGPFGACWLRRRTRSGAMRSASPNATVDRITTKREEPEAEDGPVPPEEIGVDGAHRTEGEQRREEERDHRRQHRPGHDGDDRAEGGVGRGRGGAGPERPECLEIERLDASLASDDLADDHECGQGGQGTEHRQRDRLGPDGLLRQPDRRRTGIGNPVALTAVCSGAPVTTPTRPPPGGPA